jgi:GNAT superfamily N-acetyltransferase
MAVVRFELPVAGIPACECAGIVVEPADPARAAGDLMAVAAAGDAEAEMRLRPGGLAAELTSRPGREVWAWIARERAAESRPVGFVALVRAGGQDEPRWSIGWLVVDSASRRRGIGTALVATAVRFAGARGAGIVHVETLDRWTAAVAFWEGKKGS